MPPASRWWPQTLDALVAQMDIDDKDQAVQTLREYNAAARRAEEGFDPARKRDGLSDLRAWRWRRRTGG